MTEHSKLILEKLKSEEYPKLNFDFTFKLTNESERGAILIGASKVEAYLESLILKVLPSNEKSYTSKLFNYPGPLSSFSGKIELSYAFGIIDKKVYNSLTSLRKIRNNAAHSSDVFSLQEIKETLEQIYDFQDGFRNVIHNLSFDNLVRWKKEHVRQSFIDENLYEEEDFENRWNEHVPNPELNEDIQQQLIIWKLAYGLTFLCLQIEVIQDEYKNKKQTN